MRYVALLYRDEFANFIVRLRITRLASKEIFSPSNKIHREVGRAKDLSAPPVNVGSEKEQSFT